MMRSRGAIQLAVLGVLLWGATSATAMSAERSFTLDGKKYSLNFPADLLFFRRDTGDHEMLWFGDYHLGIMFISHNKLDYIEPSYTANEPGDFNIKKVRDVDYYMHGACTNIKIPNCVYTIFRNIDEYDKLLAVTVFCARCNDKTMRRTGELADHIGSQLRYR